MAFLIDVFTDLFSLKNKYVVFNLVSRNLKIKYRKSILGVLWTILIPAATAAVYYFVFQKIMRIPVDNYLLFILTGILPWSFFAGSVVAGLESIVGNHHLLSKVPISPAVFPYSDTITAFINLVLAIPIYVGVLWFSSVDITVHILLLPVFLGLVFLQAYFFGLLFGVMFVFLRDLRHVLAVVMQLWFYLTPVLYSSEMIPKKYKAFQYLNPLATIFDGMHTVVLRAKSPEPQDFVAMFAWTLIIMIVATVVYRWNKRTIVESI